MNKKDQSIINNFLDDLKKEGLQTGNIIYQEKEFSIENGVLIFDDTPEEVSILKKFLYFFSVCIVIVISFFSYKYFTYTPFPEISIKELSQDEQKLMNAVKTETPETFMEKVKNVDIRLLRNENGLTLLHQAAQAGQTGLIDPLISRGLNIDEKDLNGWTPLMHAVAFGKKEVLEHILSLKPDMKNSTLKDTSVNNITIPAGSSPLLIAQLSDNTNIQSLLEQRIEELNSELYTLIENGKFDECSPLLRQGADINFKSQSGEAPVHLAVRKNDSLMLEQLFEMGADPNIKDKNGNTPLHISIMSDSQSCFEKILKLPIKPPINSREKWNDFIVKIGLKDKEALNKSWVRLNEKNLLNKSPVMTAIDEQRDFAIDALLLESEISECLWNDGSDIVSRLVQKNLENTLKKLPDSLFEKVNINKFGYSPLYYTLKNKNKQITEFLIQKGHSFKSPLGNGQTWLIAAASAGSLSYCKKFIADGVSVHTKDMFGQTALTEASKNGHLDIAKYLIDQESSITNTDNNGNSSLIIAALNGHEDLVDYFLSQQALSIDTDAYFRCFLACAEGNCPQSMKKLIPFISNINQKTEDGWTALMVAAVNNSTEVYTVIISNGGNPELIIPDGLFKGMKIIDVRNSFL